MSKEKLFCNSCNIETKYIINSKEISKFYKDKIYTFLGKEITCNVCKSVIHDNTIMKCNLESLHDIYRKDNNIISYYKIIEIPEKYSIGKRPLSQLLGWGELTFTRYYDGDIPTSQYSEILKNIYDNPEYYLNLLESNKDNLKSINAYEKSKRKTEALLGLNEDSKINDVAKYIMCQCGDITPLALQKVLYYVQGFHHAFYKTHIFNDECEACSHGPIYRNIYSMYKDYKLEPNLQNEKFDNSVFTKSEKEIIDNVVKHICCYSGHTLEKFVHQELPWKVTRGDLCNTEHSNKIINKKCICNYFIDIKEKYKMKDPSDIKKYTQSMFKSIS